MHGITLEAEAVVAGLMSADLGSHLNGVVAFVLRDMSYGKTTLNATVAPQVFPMGKPSLDGYDIVGVQFPSIGLTSGGVVWSGLASVGGFRRYLRGNIGDGTIIHEFGHNYGLHHASFWKTSDGSVAGAGQSVEYGDPFDIMGGGDPPSGHFHMRAKQRLNWLGAAN